MIDNVFPIISISAGKKFTAIPDRLTIQRELKGSYRIKSANATGRLFAINEFKEIHSSFSSKKTDALIMPFLTSSLIEKYLKDGSNFDERITILPDAFRAWYITGRSLYFFCYLS